jgi:hypothetical protein
LENNNVTFFIANITSVFGNAISLFYYSCYYSLWNLGILTEILDDVQHDSDNDRMFLGLCVNHLPNSILYKMEYWLLEFIIIKSDCRIKWEISISVKIVSWQMIIASCHALVLLKS